MDAHAYLISQGWQGDGHALDARPYEQKGRRGLAYDPKQVRSTGGNGLVKPLLISQRKDRFGIGKKAHEPAAGNQWWLAGFEKALGNVGKSESERETTASVSGTATPESSSGYKGKHAGLYGHFVKGQAIGGTIGEELFRKSKKRKSGEIFETEAASSEDGSTGASSRASRKGRNKAEFEVVGAFLAVRDKDEKRKKKSEKADALEEFQQVGQFFEARSERKKDKRKSETRPVEDGNEVEADSIELRMETKEERRERRQRRKKEKAARVAAVPNTVENADGRRSSDDESEAKLARKVERRRKKEQARLAESS